MGRILKHDTPEDFVLATGVIHSVRDFVELAFQNIDIQIIWKGKTSIKISKR